MNVVTKLLEALKAVVYMPVYIYQIFDKLLRIEKKLDLFAQQLNNLKADKLTNDHLGKVEFQALKQDIISEIEGQFKNELSNLMSTIDQKLENQFLQLESLLSLYNSLPNLKLLPATRGWAGSPDFLAKIAEVILKEKPCFVLEASSGVSTIIIGLALKLNSYGKVISLDHNRLYANITREYIEVNNIAHIADARYCPLKDYTSFKQNWIWYDIENLNLTKKIDMLVIDGPPGTTQFLARFPAVPLLHEYFTDRTLILLDDASRNDESIIIQKWIGFLESNNFKTVVTQFNNFEKGMAILEVRR